MRGNAFFFSASFLILLGSCSQNQAPEGTAVPLEPGTAAVHSSEGLQFAMPEGWVKEVPKSPMRTEQYRLPGDGGDAELAVFAGIGGSVEQNIDRWIAQFSDPEGGSVKESARVSREQVGDFELTFVDVSGTFSAGMGAMGQGGEPQAGYRMLAAVIASDSSPWFLKLTGPAETVERWEDSFYTFARSAH